MSLIKFLLLSFPLVVPSTFSLSKNEVNFGEVSRSSKVVSDTLWLKNNADTPLLIHSVSLSCSCLSYEYDTRPIIKGDSSMIIINFAPDMNGYFHKTLTIKTNGVPKKIKLPVIGTVVSNKKDE